jgi:CheY-like chemotaxis protein
MGLQALIPPLPTNPALPRLLIVDDSEAVCRGFARFFAPYANVVTQSDPVLASAWLTYEDFDAALVDLRMCPLDGLDVLAHAKALRDQHGRAMPRCVVFTGWIITEREVLLAKSIGVVAIVEKPYTPEALRALVVQALAGTKVATP